jgi:hypothetical protein
MAILAQQYPVFQRAMRIISDITNASPAIVTTTFNHQYETGMIVRLWIPDGYGMVQANRLYGSIIVTGDTTFTIDIDTTNFEAYTTPSTYPQNRQYAQVVPIGEVTSLLTSATKNALPYSAT